ncbi:hypothetical protein EIP91_003589 [Steccherinum ochraceum]|uniref:Polysaccharide lyase family 8 protein n=1 Tax=Steccherinum ochraceum TaxID=92696 RepID=A0A4R0RAB4_9APHY|nr:hypothetical protein EIP91_003589 [Steccherinum ochraceum]
MYSDDVALEGFHPLRRQASTFHSKSESADYGSSISSFKFYGHAHGQSTSRLPLMPGSNFKNKRRRITPFYIIVIVVSVCLVVAIICAAVLATRHKNSQTSSASVNADSKTSDPTNTTKPANATVQDDIGTMASRRLSVIVGGLQNASSIPAWMSTLGPDGKWPDSEIDYTTGCKAQGANWPASLHWIRIENMAAAWHGGFDDGAQYTNSNDLASKISSAMDWWFANDFTEPACLVGGGGNGCGCDTPGLWNTNWFASVILVPKPVLSSCLLFNSSLTATQRGNCSKFADRTYGTFATGISGGTPVTGANTLDIATVSIDGGLLVSNATMLSDVFNRVHSEIVVQDKQRADGICADGSFAQHKGILYNGNYGKDYTNDAVALEIEAADTRYQANTASRDAFQTLIDGDQWMIYRNTLTNVLHWDFNVLARFLVLPVADAQGTAQINLNLTQIQVLGQLWQSDTLTQTYNSLVKNTTDANAGQLMGNRMFYANDYMVHRGSGYVTSVRMYSSRTRSTECVNTQNPFGFHMADGAVYTYLDGSEYEDISAAWDWNLAPGTTVDYDATPLECSTCAQDGLESFVGGVSTGSVGIAAMRYQNPLTKKFSFQKAWFFLPNDVQHVMIPVVTSETSAPVFSVLDQRKHSGDILVDNNNADTGNFTDVTFLWHGGVGYTFNPEGSVSLSLQVGPRTGDWTAIGTSHQPPVTVDLFAAWLHHLDLSKAVSYSVYPATTPDTFQSKSSAPTFQSVQNDGSISAMTDTGFAMVVFWGETGGSVSVPTSAASITISSDGPSMVIVDLTAWNVTVSDPTQTSQSVSITIALGSGSPPSGWPSSTTSKTLSVSLPGGTSAGKSVSQALFS